MAERVLEAGRWSGVGKYLNRTLQCKLKAKQLRGRNGKIIMRNSPNGRESGVFVDILL